MEEQKTVTYTWTTPMPQSSGNWMNCGTYPAKVLRQGHITLQLYCEYYSRYDKSFKALIRKSHHDSVKVTIEFKVDDTTYHTGSLCEWKDVYEIPEFSMSSRGSTNHTITCIITWNLTLLYPTPTPANLHDEVKIFNMNPAFSDVTIVVEGEELPAHKLVLSACSPVFFSMMTVPMKETKENRIIIDDVPCEIMKTILNFMYEGGTEPLNDVDTALEVLAAAEKYDMKKLKEICAYKLYKGLTIENALEILTAAELYDATELKKISLEFINVNKKYIVESVAFESFCYDYPLLTCNFIRDVIRDL